MGIKIEQWGLFPNGDGLSLLGKIEGRGYVRTSHVKAVVSTADGHRFVRTQSGTIYYLGEAIGGTWKKEVKESHPDDFKLFTQAGIFSEELSNVFGISHDLNSLQPG